MKNIREARDSMFQMNPLSRSLIFVFVWSVSSSIAAAERPNILIIYADDIGYGDFSCYGGTGVQTPAVDRLASSGVRHLSGYSSASTCTPSRYSLLTGEYAFRNKRAKILEGNAPLIIDPERPNLPCLLRDAGYDTALVGKWHLGLGYEGESLDWNESIAPGPLDLGFNHAFFMAATADRVPSVYIEGDRIRDLDLLDPIKVSYTGPEGSDPTGLSHPHLLRMQADLQHSGTIVNGVSRIGSMTGGRRARFEDESMTDTYLAEAIKFLEAKRTEPFFLLFAATENHVPRMPHPRFVGSTGLGSRGDSIAQFDWTVARLLETLATQGLRENTLVIVTSDNGPALFDGYWDGAEELNGDHRPSGPYRGGKYSSFEGGTRSPFIVNWPARVKPGLSDALISQTDLLASIAGLLEIPVAETAGHDGQDVHLAILGESDTGRDFVVQQGASSLSIRVGDWKYMPAGMQLVRRDGIDSRERVSLAAPGGLFYLPEDPGEEKNLVEEYPHRLQTLKTLLESVRKSRG